MEKHSSLTSQGLSTQVFECALIYKDGRWVCVWASPLKGSASLNIAKSMPIKA